MQSSRLSTNPDIDIFVIRTIFKRYLTDVKSFLNQKSIWNQPMEGSGSEESRLIGIDLLAKLNAAIILLDPPESDVLAERTRISRENDITPAQQNEQLKLDQITAIRDVLESFENGIAVRTGLPRREPANLSHEMIQNELSDLDGSPRADKRERRIAHDIKALQAERVKMITDAAQDDLQLKQHKSFFQQLHYLHGLRNAQGGNILPNDAKQLAERELFLKEAYLQQLRFVAGQRKPDQLNILPNDAKKIGRQNFSSGLEEKPAQELIAARVRILKQHTLFTRLLKKITIKEILLRFISAEQSAIASKNSDAEVVENKLDNIISTLNLDNLPPIKPSVTVRSARSL